MAKAVLMPSYEYFAIYGCRLAPEKTRAEVLVAIEPGILAAAGLLYLR